MSKLVCILCKKEKGQKICDECKKTQKKCGNAPKCFKFVPGTGEFKYCKTCACAEYGCNEFKVESFHLCKEHLAKAVRLTCCICNKRDADVPFKTCKPCNLLRKECIRCVKKQLHINGTNDPPKFYKFCINHKCNSMNCANERLGGEEYCTKCKEKATKLLCQKCYQHPRLRNDEDGTIQNLCFLCVRDESAQSSTPKCKVYGCINMVKFNVKAKEYYEFCFQCVCRKYECINRGKPENDGFCGDPCTKCFARGCMRAKKHEETDWCAKCYTVWERHQEVHCLTCEDGYTVDLVTSLCNMCKNQQPQQELGKSCDTDDDDEKKENFQESEGDEKSEESESDSDLEESEWNSAITRPKKEEWGADSEEEQETTKPTPTKPIVVAATKPIVVAAAKPIAVVAAKPITTSPPTKPIVVAAAKPITTPPPTKPIVVAAAKPITTPPPTKAIVVVAGAKPIATPPPTNAPAKPIPKTVVAHASPPKLVGIPLPHKPFIGFVPTTATPTVPPPEVFKKCDTCDNFLKGNNRFCTKCNQVIAAYQDMLEKATRNYQLEIVASPISDHKKTIPDKNPDQDQHRSSAGLDGLDQDQQQTSDSPDKNQDCDFQEFKPRKDKRSTRDQKKAILGRS
jgi:hypothetical protein